LGMTSYILSILIFVLKLILKKLLSIEILIFHISGIIIRTSMVTNVTMRTQPWSSRPHTANYACS
jgi:hypothetical protein